MAYVDAIMNARANTSLTLERFDCPAINTSRYAPLKHVDPLSSGKVQYFFALMLRDCLSLLPMLLGTVVRAMEFLGPSSCALSVVEGNSPDGTADVVAALKHRLTAMRVPYFYLSSTINPADTDRIGRLAALRNLALQPLWQHADLVTNSTTIVFLNDVAACPEDILELAYQRQQQHADMTCAMDWTFVFDYPTFYDVWVTRSLTGNAFFEIPLTGSWDLAWNLFPDSADAPSRRRYHQRRPFQVFSCWNGAVTMSAKPFLEPHELRFRNFDRDAGECEQGEPQLLCKDLWFRGFGHIAVVPSVSLEYSVELGLKIKTLKGFTSELVSTQDPGSHAIVWQDQPPKDVLCMGHGWREKFWQPWNFTLV